LKPAVRLAAVIDKLGGLYAVERRQILIVFDLNDVAAKVGRKDRGDILTDDPASPHRDHFTGLDYF